MSVSHAGAGRVRNSCPGVPGDGVEVEGSRGEPGDDQVPHGDVPQRQHRTCRDLRGDDGGVVGDVEDDGPCGAVVVEEVVAVLAGEVAADVPRHVGCVGTRLHDRGQGIP